MKRNPERTSLINEIFWNFYPEDNYAEINEPEQITVLLSLVYGVRLKLGQINRTFTKNQEELGNPTNQEVEKNPLPIKLVSPTHCILPSALHSNLNASDSEIFYTFKDVGKSEALALLRSAKLYSDALQMIEFEASLSWVMLVSAIEITADVWRKSKGINSNLKQFSEVISNEKYGCILKYCKDNHAKRIKEEAPINDKTGVELKFYAFILHFLPDEPKTRPEGCYSIGWDESLGRETRGEWSIETILPCLISIYDRRSKALHAGIAFPARMHSPKLRNGRPHERSCLNVTDGEAISIRTFEYIVRGSLLGWWSSGSIHKSVSVKSKLREAYDAGMIRITLTSPQICIIMLLSTQIKG